MPLPVSPSTCNALIRRSIDLRRLYRHAATACEPGLRVVLNENAQTLDQLIADLQAQLRAGGGKPSEHGSWRAAARRHLAGWLIHAGTRRDSAWIRALAHHETALLHAFEQAIAEAPADSALALRRQLPRLHGIHLDMHSLAGSARY
ncbi:MAG TPA: DUF2383 domain-containing protein [Rhodanobacter sp.]|nr:DUF2383 domain-containing protein [Rhodanobacter sp.]